MDVNKYAHLCLNRKTRIIVKRSLSIRDHDKFYDYENKHKYRQKPKIQ